MHVNDNVKERASGHGMCPPERARFLSIARGSALECGVILDVAVATGVLDATPVGARQDASSPHRRHADQDDTLTFA